MSLTKLKLTQFKNYKELSFDINQSVVCFVGENGEGKTNLLDAIYYTCIGKSYFNSVEKQNMMHQTDFFRIESQIHNSLIEITYPNQGKKKIKKDKIEYERLADHLGFAPVSFIAPDDNMIILGGSEIRRRFFNSSISQFNASYVKDVMAYRKLLFQRNSHLKSGKIQETLLATYDAQLVPLAQMIHSVRKTYVKEFSNVLSEIYRKISREKETVSCKYYSQLNDERLEDLFFESREKDRLLQRTTKGIHRDDLKFKIDGNSLKNFGSQGQQKTFLLALKLAEYHLINQHSGQNSILLLDDIFDKLDRGRIRELFKYLINNQAGQIFMTDTNGQRLFEVLSTFNIDFTIFIVEKNKLVNYEHRQ